MVGPSKHVEVWLMKKIRDHSLSSCSLSHPDGQRLHRVTLWRWLIICFMISINLIACLSEPPIPSPLESSSSSSSSNSSGPLVQQRPFDRPFPLAPFPNDSVTRFDPHSPTERRLNLPLEDHTREGRHVRAQLNELDGFALFSPITVSFDAQLDLTTVTPRSVYLVELGEQPRLISLDLGDGFFPINSPLGWFMGLPPLKPSPNIFFSGMNQASALRWKTEDDQREALLRFQRGEESHLTHYEIESDTLIIRSLLPLKEHQQYAVILTDELKGWSNQGQYGPIRSPYQRPYSTRDALVIADNEPWLLEQLSGSIAYAWTFTTGKPSIMLDQVHDGLYGEGSLSYLEYEPRFDDIREMGVDFVPPSPRWHSRLLPASVLERFSSIVATVTSNSGYAIDFPDVDYFVFGSFTSPQLRSKDQIWMVDTTGSPAVTPPPLPPEGEIPFMLSVPRSSVRAEPPFPVVIYFHGTNSSRLEGLILAQELAAQGIALLSFDQVGHGPIIRNYKTFDVDNPQFGQILSAIPSLIARLIAPHLVEEVQGLSFSEGLDRLSQVGLFQELAVIGRWEDVNQDGKQGDAEGFFDPNPKRLCSAFWQDTVDAMSLIKLLRSLSPLKVPPRLDHPQDADEARLQAHMRAGDFNADGVLDIGGGSVQISAAGTSLGGIHSLLLGAVDPEIDIVTPIVPGAGLLDILSRTSLRFLSRPIFESYLGQAVVGCPNQGREASAKDEPNSLYISLGDDARRCERDRLRESALSILDGDHRGARVELYNHRTKEGVFTEIDQRGGFTLHLASDKEDPLELTVYSPNDSTIVISRHRFKARVNGSGRALNTPDLRRSAYILNQLLERCDPMIYTSRYRPDESGDEAIKTLISVALGDQAVPINTSISLANGLGLLGLTEEEWRPRLEALRDQGVLLGSPPAFAWDDQSDPNAPLFDVDQLLIRDDESGETQADSLGPLPALPVSDGLSAIRFANVEGNHEWIAGYTRGGFNYGLHTMRQVAAYHRCSGRVIIDEDPWCLQADSCPLTERLYLRDDCQLE